MALGLVHGATYADEGGSLLPGWFRRDSQPAATGKNAPQPAPRTATAPRVGSAPAPPQLPGLGGSPLPPGDWTPAGSSGARRADVAREIASDYPVIREDSPGTSAPSANSTSAAPRQSPHARPTPQINPEQLRRELSGTFETKTHGNAPARTARLEPAARDATEPLAAPNNSQAAGSARDASPYDTPLTLPIVEQSPWGSTESELATDRNEPAAGATTPPAATLDSTEQGRGSAATSNAAAAPFAASSRTEALPAITPTVRGKEAFGEALQIASGGDPSVLAANQAPMITTDIRGPKQILLGRESTYRVRVQNQGAAAAEGLIVSVRIPAWAEVAGTTATQGSVQANASASSPQLDWQLARLDGRGNETLDLRLIPRQSRPMELGVSWTLAAVASKAIVEVQEPKLQIDVAGPAEVLYEKPQVFRLTLSNPGTGPAENVNIQLVPPGGGKASTHPLGNLEAGETKTVEVELTAREAGKLAISAVATAEGGLTCDATKEIFCRKPELEVEWRGPATKYAGTTATYFFRVRNPGTAPAEDVNVVVTLPEGAEFTSGSQGQSFDAQRREVTWRVGTLSPGDDTYLELKCTVNTAGANPFRITAATAAGDLTDSETAETNVIALADLKLEVSDPSGPVAVGSPAIYEIRVHNRGASSAKDVSIVGLFSEGIEPDSAEGCQYTATDGRVSFHAIEDLPAGRDITLKIRAHAVKPGTHVFRAEVLCRDAEIKLAAEETTRFYTDEVVPQGN